MEPLLVLVRGNNQKFLEYSYTILAVHGAGIEPGSI